MTTYQLREICRQERLINGIHAPLDKDALIWQIMRFRGREDRLFITKPVDGGWERLERLLSSARLNLNNPHTFQGCAKITAYNGISIEYFDHFTIGYLPELADTNALLVSDGELCAIFNLRAYGNSPDKLFITKAAGLDCKESKVRNYTLYCMDRAQSDLLYNLYMENHLLCRSICVSTQSPFLILRCGPCWRAGCRWLSTLVLPILLRAFI